MMITMVADENIPFLRGALEPFCRVIYLPGDRIRPGDVKMADGLIVRTRTQCNEALLAGSSVKFIATATIGFDHIDTEFCKSAGIRWFHAAGCNSSGVYQYLASALLTLLRQRGWKLPETTIGIVGVGHVGSKIVSLAEVIGMQVLQNDPPREKKEGKGNFVDLQQIADRADIITLHVPLTKEGGDKTLHLAGDGFFRSLKRSPVIINTSRGPVVEEKSLKEHLRSGSVSGAILDVWETEPQPDQELLSMADIGTPHIAGYSTEGKANCTASCVRQTCRFFGFGTGDWHPPDLPPPSHPDIRLHPLHKSLEEILYEAVTTAYDILRDDQKLRENPQSFEQIRNEYPVRREFPAHQIELSSPHEEAERVLRGMGFTFPQLINSSQGPWYL